MPTFEWVLDSKGSPKNQVAIYFPDGGSNDVAILKLTIPIPSANVVDDNAGKIDHCIFHGHLRDEIDVAVSVNGCPGTNTFEVMLF